MEEVGETEEIERKVSQGGKRRSEVILILLSFSGDSLPPFPTNSKGDRLGANFETPFPLYSVRETHFPLFQPTRKGIGWELTLRHHFPCYSVFPSFSITGLAEEKSPTLIRTSDQEGIDEFESPSP